MKSETTAVSTTPAHPGLFCAITRAALTGQTDAQIMCRAIMGEIASCYELLTYFAQTIHHRVVIRRATHLLLGRDTDLF